ncbi:MAG: hypothetical protein HGA33_00515 [Candidatus Moranbacteria bacterium]|nr:hypothetical protein [Candidatus Moranbacteria bacterium]
MKEVPVPSQSIERIAPVPTAPNRDFSDERNDNISHTEAEHRERIEALREWIQQYLENRFPEYGPDTESDFIEHCRQSGFEEALSANRPGNATSEADSRNIGIGSIATETFLHEVINTMREHSDDREVMARFQESLSENSRLDHWALENLDDTGFISVYTDYERSAGISEPAIETPFPLMRTYFADRFASMNESDLRNLADDLSERSPGERIDIIRFLPVPISLDEDDFEPPKNVREEYRKRFRFVLERLADTDIAAIRLSALNRLADQEAYWYKCDEAGGEAFLEYGESLFNEEESSAEFLKKSVIPDKQLPYHYFAGRVATDAIAFFDGPGFPRYIAHAPSERLDRFESMAPSTDWSAITDLRRELRKMPFNSITEIHYVLSEVEKALFEEEMQPDSDSLAREFSKISNALDEPFWKAYFELKKELDHLLEEDWEQTQTLERNFEAKQDVLKAQIEEIARKHKEGQSDGSGLAETLPETIHSLLKQDTTDLNEHLSQTFQSRAQNKELEETEKHIDALLDIILTRGETFRRDLLTYLDRKLESAEEAEAFIKTHLNSYEKIQKDPTLDPFGVIDPESLRLIQALHSPNAKDLLGMDFSKLPLRAQIHFLSFRGKEKTSDAERFRLALGKHEDISDDLAYSFLATAESPEYGETILSLAERLDTETLGPILQKYAEITKDTDSVTDYMRTEFPHVPQETLYKVSGDIAANLLRDGRALLVEFSTTAGGNQNGLLRRLERVQVGTELFKEALSTLSHNGEMPDLSEIASMELVSIAAEDLTQTEKSEMRDLYDQNYPASKGYSEKFRRHILESLDDAFEKKGVRFYLLKRNGHIDGYIRFEDIGKTEDGRIRKYFGSFNTKTELQHLKLGNALFDKCFEKEGTDAVLEAVADTSLPISAYYLERRGFVATGVEQVVDRLYFNIRLDPKMNDTLITKRLRVDGAIAEQLRSKGSPRGYIKSERHTRNDMGAVSQDRLKNNWVLTHTLPVPGNPGDVTAVFEHPRPQKDRPMNDHAIAAS